MLPEKGVDVGADAHEHPVILPAIVHELAEFPIPIGAVFIDDQIVLTVYRDLPIAVVILYRRYGQDLGARVVQYRCHRLSLSSVGWASRSRPGVDGYAASWRRSQAMRAAPPCRVSARAWAWASPISPSTHSQTQSSGSILTISPVSWKKRISPSILLKAPGSSRSVAR